MTSFSFIQSFVSLILSYICLGKIFPSFHLCVSWVTTDRQSSLGNPTITGSFPFPWRFSFLKDCLTVLVTKSVHHCHHCLALGGKSSFSCLRCQSKFHLLSFRFWDWYPISGQSHFQQWLDLCSSWWPSIEPIDYITNNYYESIESNDLRQMYNTQYTTPKFALQTVLVFGPESVSYERSRLIRRCILREISARVFFEKIPKYRKNIFPIFPGCPEIPGNVFQK